MGRVKRSGRTGRGKRRGLSSDKGGYSHWEGKGRQSPRNRTVGLISDAWEVIHEGRDLKGNQGTVGVRDRSKIFLKKENWGPGRWGERSERLGEEARGRETRSSAWSQAPVTRGEKNRKVGTQYKGRKWTTSREGGGEGERQLEKDL